jgi:tRNA threonylcarbamoyladenosine biosynthesis protein TsaB
MYSLFLDTTQGLTVGLLDENWAWIFYEATDEKKPSEVIHEKIFSMLKLYGLELKNLRLFTIAGPGSYTGMRLSEGIATITSWAGIEVYSFYHFEVPGFCGVEAGCWTTNAFKNQIFSYQWDEHKSSTQLLSVSNNENAFSIIQTRELIHLNPIEIFSKVLFLNHKKETYYFRTLEEEFG